MDEFIYSNPISLTNEFCEKVIELFEKSEDIQFCGEIGCVNKPGLEVIKEVKDTVDISIPNHLCDNSEWFDVHKKLKEELIINMNEYYKKIDPNNDVYKLNLLHINVSFTGFLMSRYTKNKGNFKLHNDFNIDKRSRYRIFNFLWYLNDVKDGGNTSFCNNTTINPEQGKMIIFPSEWFFSHKGEIPLSNDKYIITGWIYNDI